MLFVLLAKSIGATKPHSTTRITVNAQGEEGDWHSNRPDMTPDGRFVIFVSYAGNLVPDDTNGVSDAFVVDLETGEIERVTVSSEGQEGNNSTYYAPSISDDGQIVTYVSAADNLVPNDTNGSWDVFVHYRQTDMTVRISVSSTGEEGNANSRSPAVSADGRHVVFDSSATNLIPDGIIGQQVYRHDLQTGTTGLVSATVSGEQANGTSRGPAVSTDGRFVAFSSWADNLVPDDSNYNEDVFVKDMFTGDVERVSLTYLGEENNDKDWYPEISADGRYIAFTSFATNMHPGDSGGSKVYVYDRELDTLERVSINFAGQQGTHPSYLSNITPDGRFVVFASESANLVPSDTNQVVDTFVRDRRYGWNYRISLTNDDSEGNQSSGEGVPSADGQVIAFCSRASNLVPDDNNNSDDIFIRIQVQQALFLPLLSYAP